MREDERELPRRVGRFNYWGFFGPVRPVHLVHPEEIDPRPLLKRYSKRLFNLILTASPAVWNREVRPSLKLSDIPDRRFLALEVYVSEDAEWEGDGDARKVFNGLSAKQQKHIRQLEKKKWGGRRTARDWDNWLRDIARDIERFKEFCKIPPESGVLTGTDHRIYKAYSQQATILLGGGRVIPKERRNIYRDYYGDGSSLLTSSGRLPSKSISRQDERENLDPDWWQKLSPVDRLERKKHAIHRFQHALRNMQEYRYKRPPVPWSSRCTATCERIQKKLCTP